MDGIGDDVEDGGYDFVLVMMALIMISYQQDLPIDGRQGHEGQERVLGDHPKDV